MDDGRKSDATCQMLEKKITEVEDELGKVSTLCIIQYNSMSCICSHVELYIHGDHLHRDRLVLIDFWISNQVRIQGIWCELWTVSLHHQVAVLERLLSGTSSNSFRIVMHSFCQYCRTKWYCIIIVYAILYGVLKNIFWCPIWFKFQNLLRFEKP